MDCLIDSAPSVFDVDIAGSLEEMSPLQAKSCPEADWKETEVFRPLVLVSIGDTGFGYTHFIAPATSFPLTIIPLRAASYHHRGQHPLALSGLASEHAAREPH